MTNTTYTTLSRDEQNKILKSHGYRWEKFTQDDLDDNDDFSRTPGWYLFSADGREVEVSKAFDEINRGVDIVAAERRQQADAVAAHGKLAQNATNFINLIKHMCDQNKRDEIAIPADATVMLDRVHRGSGYRILVRDLDNGVQVYYQFNDNMDISDWTMASKSIVWQGRGWLENYEQLSNACKTLNS